VTIAELFAQRKNDRPRDAAIVNYGALFEWFAETQQRYATDLPGLADVVGHTAFMFLNARQAEFNDPEPAAAPWCACASCWLYRGLPPEAKPHREMRAEYPDRPMPDHPHRDVSNDRGVK